MCESSIEDLAHAVAAVQAQGDTLPDSLRGPLTQLSGALEVYFAENSPAPQPDPAPRFTHSYLSTEDMALLVENTLDIIGVLDREGRINYINPAIEAIIGHAPQSLINRPFDSYIRLFHPDDRTRVRTSVEGFLKTGVVRRFESVRFQHADGYYINLEIRLQAMRDAAGALSHFVFVCHDVTDHEQIKADLENTRKQLQTVIRHAPVVLFAIDSQGIFTLSEGMGLANLGFEPGQVVGLSAFDMYADNPVVIDSLKRVLAGEKWEVDTPLGDFAYRAIYNPVHDDQGSITGLIGIAFDITESQHVQAMLRDSNERFNLAMEASSMGVWELDVENNQIVIDAHVKAIMGYQDDEVPDQITDWTRFVHPEDSARIVARRINDLTAIHGKFDREFRLLHKDGGIRWILARGHINNQTHGEVLHIVGVATDITQIKQAELALQESEKRNNAILNAIPDSTALIDSNGIVLDANPRGLLPLTVAPCNLAGRHLSQVMPPNISEILIEHLRLALKSPQVRVSELTFTQDGAPVVRELRAIRVDDTVVLMIVRDITDSKETARYQLEKERMQVLKTFLDHTSHDLRTPITAIITSTHLLRRLTDVLINQSAQFVVSTHDNGLHIGSAANEALVASGETLLKINDRVNTLYQSAVRLKHLVEAIADMLLLDSDLDYEFTAEDLDPLLADMVDTYHSQAISKGIAMDYLSPHQSVPVVIDRLELPRAIRNLLTNTLEYTPRGGQVTVGLDVLADVAVVTVNDTGVGISEADLPLIFGRFYRTDKARSTDSGGIGLGLTIAKKIVEDHQGHIEVESALGKGSTFRVKIPLSRVHHPVIKK